MPRIPTSDAAFDQFIRRSTNYLLQLSNIPYQMPPTVYEFQTVDAAAVTKDFNFDSGAHLFLQIVAANTGATKSYACEHFWRQSLGLNTQNTDIANDFTGGANTSLAAAPGVVTLTLQGEAGETINWRVMASVITV